MKRITLLIASLVVIITAAVLLVPDNLEKTDLVQIMGQGFNNKFQNVTLKYFDHNTMEYIQVASKVLNADGSFEFSFPFEDSNLYELNFDEKEMIPISVESPGLISVIRKPNDTQIEGSESTKKLASFRQTNDNLQTKHFGQLKIDFDKAMAENDEKRIQELTEQSEISIQNYLKEFRQLIIDLGTTPAGYYGLQFSDFNKEIDFIEKRLKAFKEEAPESPVTKALQKQVSQVKFTSIGNTPPDFEATDKKGNLVALSDFKGKVVLIDFWASWCRACRVENPKFADLYETYQPKDFEIISISMDDSEKQWLASIEKDGINAWTQIHDSAKSISKLYSISSLPQNVLLDKSGKIIAKNITAEDLTQLLVTF